MQVLQRRVAAFVRRHRLETDVASRLLDLVAEVGEVTKEALKATGYGRKKFRPSAAWADELGDVVFALACVANTTGVDLERALEAALAKYHRRLASTGDAGSRSVGVSGETGGVRARRSRRVANAGNKKAR